MKRMCANEDCPFPGTIRYGILFFCEECASDLDLYPEGW